MTQHSVSGNQWPLGWDESRTQQLIRHYEAQTEDEAVIEDEAALELEGQSVVVIPTELVDTVRALIVKHKAS